jgi:Fe-S oxidoreductase
MLDEDLSEVTQSPEPRAESPFQGPDQPSRALIDKCVHCGFCLPTCPTYLLWGEEMDSPRGRIYLMKAGLEGRAEMTESFVQHFDRCLGCLACVTACPSGVQYAPLIEKSRVQIERRYERPEGDRLFRRLLMALIPYPSRLRVLMAPLVVLSPFMGRSGGLSPAFTKMFPARLRAFLSVAPRVSLWGLIGRTPSRTAAVGTERMKVALLDGCVQRIAFANVNEATVRVLAAEGCRVEVPHAQGCCGALPLHAGHIDQARELARHNIEVFEGAGVDRIVTNAAGCGSAMKDYGELFEGDPAWESRARAISQKVRDISQVLALHADEQTHQRNLDVLRAQIPKGEGTHSRKIRARFFVSPVEVLGTDRVEGLRLEKNRLVKDSNGVFKAQGTEVYEEIPCQLVFRSIGYKGHTLPGLPFDERNGIIPNRDGRVIDPATGQPVQRVYVAGWIKRGPSGVIGTNKPDSVATVHAMLEDMAQYPSTMDGLSADPDALPALLAHKQVRAITFAAWKKIDQIEIATGKKRGKPREKLTTIAELLDAAD